MKTRIPISITELKLIAKQEVLRIKRDDPYFFPIFRIMQLTGCRLSESLEKKLWNIKNNNTITLQTAKNNSKRIFYNNNCNNLDELVTLINNHYNLYFEESNGLKIAQNYIGRHNLYHANKKITTSLFRHLYIKDLKEKGLSDFDIQEEMGHKELASTQNYIYGQIMKQI